MEVEKINQKSLSVILQADSYVITNQETLEQSSVFLQKIKGVKKEIDETFDPMIEAAHKSHREAIAQKKKFYQPLDIAEATIKNKIGIYMTAQEEKRKEEQAKIEAATNQVVILEKEKKPEGISMRKVYRWKLDDMSKVKPEFLKVDETKINAIVRSIGRDATALVGGIVVYEDSVISSRSL